MFNKQFILTAILTLFMTGAFATEKAGCMGCLETGDIFLTLEAGISFSNSALLEVETSLTDTERYWGVTAEGYNDDLGKSEVLGAGISYVLNQLAVFEIEVARRNSFEYDKYQHNLSPTIPTPTFQRHFDFQNTTAMANLVLNGSGLPTAFAYRNDYFAIDPFINGGAGIGYNTVSDFHTFTASGIPISILETHTKIGFAYQFGAGFNLRTEENLGVGFGYRYVYGGHFETDDYIASNSITPGAEVPPWKGQLRTNEIYMTVNYYL